MSDNTIEFEAIPTAYSRGAGATRLGEPRTRGTWITLYHEGGDVNVELAKKYRVTLTRIEPEPPRYRGKALSRMTWYELEEAIAEVEGRLLLDTAYNPRGSDALIALRAEIAMRPEPLKPCPCKGGDGDKTTVVVVSEDEGYRVACQCGWLGPWRSIKADAIAAWNRRP